MTVTKVVLVLRIPEQLSLHFYDFSTNCYVFSKFAVLKFICNFSFGPLKLLFLLTWGPWRKTQNRARFVRRFPAMGLAGGEGKVGEKGEGFTPHLMVVLARREVDGGGGSTAE